MRPSTVGVFEQIVVKREHRQRRQSGAMRHLPLATVVVTGALVALRRRTPRTRSRPPAGRVSSSTPPRRSTQGGPWSWSRWGSPRTRDTCDRPSFLRATPSPSRRTTARTAASPSRRRASCASQSSDGRIRDRVDLEGEIVALADGEGARWALTRDQVVDGPTDPRFRVKRSPATERLRRTRFRPAKSRPARSSAGGGAVWVPVRDGVLRYDLTTGAFAAKIPLAPAERRDRRRREGHVRERWRRRCCGWTRRRALRRRRARPSATPVLGLTSSPRTPLVELLAPDVTGEAIVADAFGDRMVRLPANVDASGLRSANGVVWVDATIDGTVVAILLDEVRAAVSNVSSDCPRRVTPRSRSSARDRCWWSPAVRCGRLCSVRRDDPAAVDLTATKETARASWSHGPSTLVDDRGGRRRLRPGTGRERCDPGGREG